MQTWRASPSPIRGAWKIESNVTIPQAQSPVLTHVYVHPQESSSILPPTDFTLPVQHGMLLLSEALGPRLRLQRNDLCIALPGWLSDLHWHRQGNG